jgi:hypothetical protein
MPALSKPVIARMASYRFYRHGGSQRCFTSGNQPWRGKKLNGF